MNILLACSAGMSTSLVEKSIKEYMAKNGIEGRVEAHAADVAKVKIEEFDVVLLGPQVRFMLAQFKAIAKDVPVDVINSADYAMAKGENIFKTASNLLASQ